MASIVAPNVPIAIAVFLAGAWFIKQALFKASSPAPSPPVFGPWYLPRFVRGLIAIIWLGANEDSFLLHLKEKYGPIVYVPFPLSQNLVLDGDVIQKIYGMPATTLAFSPYRILIQYLAFGSSKYVVDAPFIPNRLFPLHARGLANVRLEEPVDRFVQEVTRCLEELGSKVDEKGGSLDINLFDFVIDTMFDAGLAALFGRDFVERAHRTNLHTSFNEFDGVFPLLVSGLFPRWLPHYFPGMAKGMKGREKVVDVLSDWIKAGMPGLDEGLVRDTAEVGLSEQLPLREVAYMVGGDLWASQANAPHAACSLILYVIQSPLIGALIEEIRALPKSADDFPDLSFKSMADMPLTTSCIQESLRLSTSSFSIRLVEKDFVLSVPPSPLSSATSVFIPKGARVTCVTRPTHITGEGWGDDPSVWDGERFLPREGEDAETRGKKLRNLRAFGGGISICEGRVLATAELKAMLILLLWNFDFEPLYPTAKGELTPALPIHTSELPFKTSTGISPKRAESRPGLGAFQYDGLGLMVRLRRRVL